MEEIKKAKERIAKLLESVTEKSQIDALSEVSSALDKVEEKHTKLESEKKDLLEDYRKAVKNASSGGRPDDDKKEEFSFETFADGYIKENFK